MGWIPLFAGTTTGHTRWYALDLPDVTEYRKILLPEPERQAYFDGDAFPDGWIRQICTDDRIRRCQLLPAACKAGLRFSTEISMGVSDRPRMVKMSHLK